MVDQLTLDQQAAAAAAAAAAATAADIYGDSAGNSLYSSVYGSTATGHPYSAAAAAAAAAAENPLYMQQNIAAAAAAASTGASPYQSIYTAADQRYFPASEYLACSYRSLSTYYPEYAQYSYLQEMTSSTRPPLYESQLLQSSANSHQQDECKYGYDSGQQAKEVS